MGSVGLGPEERWTAVTARTAQDGGSALGARRSALGARRSALGARRSALGARRSALGARRSALGARRSALGARRSALGARRSALGARRSALAGPGDTLYTMDHSQRMQAHVQVTGNNNSRTCSGHQLVAAWRGIWGYRGSVRQGHGLERPAAMNRAVGHGCPEQVRPRDHPHPVPLPLAGEGTLGARPGHSGSLSLEGGGTGWGWTASRHPCPVPAVGRTTFAEESLTGRRPGGRENEGGRCPRNRPGKRGAGAPLCEVPPEAAPLRARRLS